MRIGLLVAVAACAALVVTAAPAAGDGGPGQGAVQGWDGVARGAERYVAVPAGGWTTVQAINRNGGRVMRWMEIKGTWGIPLVSADGARDALLRDGHTLVLGQVTAGPFLRKRSSFAFADLKHMYVKRTIDVPGPMTFDAMSPDAHYMYLTEYVSQQNFFRYRVRAFDLRASRLLPKIVSDRSSWETTMQGWPVSRAHRDGWAYTLYAGSGARPFIHALDTRHVSAVCIDLPWKDDPYAIGAYRLHWDGSGHLVVRGPRGRALVTVDRKTSRVLSFVRNP